MLSPDNADTFISALNSAYLSSMSHSLAGAEGSTDLAPDGMWSRPISPPPSAQSMRTGSRMQPRRSGSPPLDGSMPSGVSQDVAADAVAQAMLPSGVTTPMSMPIPMGPPTPTASSPPMGISPDIQMSVRSPPTPAPSPGPRSKWTISGFGDTARPDAHATGTSSPSGSGQPADGSGIAVDNFANAEDETMYQGSGLWEDFARATEIPPADLLRHFQGYSQTDRFAFLHALVGDLGLHEALVVSRRIEPRLRRDFLRELPPELALHCLSFVDDVKTLGRASQVSRYWYNLLQDDSTWKDICIRNKFFNFKRMIVPSESASSPDASRWTQTVNAFGLTIPAGSSSSSAGPPRRKSDQDPIDPSPSFLPNLQGMPAPQTSFKQRFMSAYQTHSNWMHGGWIVASHAASAGGVVTCTAVDDKYLVIGMANSGIHVFSATDGSYIRNLVGHTQGVWTLCLVSPVARKSAAQRDAAFSTRKPGTSRRASLSNPPGDFAGPANTIDANDMDPTGDGSSGSSRPNTVQGYPGNSSAGSSTRQDPSTARKQKMSDPCGSAEGWGVMRPILVSGGCDKRVKVWDILSGACVHSLAGHTSTIRCVKVLDGRPIAISGSRDGTLRVWDIHRGKCLRTLRGHEESVRCIEIAGNKVVSGSYDNTARIWDIDTGACLHVLRGHYHQIYAIGFDGLRVITGSLDSTIRVWSATTGNCVALLQGHTSLIGQIHLYGDRLISGGSDGRVICFDLNTFECLYRSCAHDNSVTSIQMDDRWLLSGGNDGRVKLWDAATGAFIRELTVPCDAIWRCCFKDDRVFMLCQRGGRSVLEMVTFRPGETGLVQLRISS